MRLHEQELEIQAPSKGPDLVCKIQKAVEPRIPKGLVPIRFAITQSDSARYRCELGLMTRDERLDHEESSIFSFVRRPVENSDQFNAVLLVPTGIGAEIGGHAGDAAPVARLLGATCDTLITHPNAVNASDLNEMPENALYVEGSVLCRLLMGTVGLQRVRSNRVLAVIDGHHDELFVNLAINAVNAARTAYGIDCSHIVQLDPSIRLIAGYSASGSAVGCVEDLERL